MKIFMEAPNILMKLPIIFGLNFWKGLAWFRHRLWIEPILDSRIHFLFGNNWNLRIGYKMSTWNFLNNLEVQEQFGWQVKQLYLVWKLGKIWFPHFNCFHMWIVRSSNFIWMPWCKQECKKKKSGKILRIFQCRAGAVTILPPLQESRPEILGLSEKGGIFLTKTSLSLPSGFFFAMVRPLDF